MPRIFNFFMLHLRFLFLSILAIWILGFSLPLITNYKNPVVYFLLERIYSRVCHQESLKCLSIGSSSMFVCARCAGIYIGGLAAGLSLLFFIPTEMKRRMIIISAFPIMTDVLFTLTGIYPYSQSLAFATGLTFGSVIYFAIMFQLDNYFQLN